MTVAMHAYSHSSDPADLAFDYELRSLDEDEPHEVARAFAKGFGTEGSVRSLQLLHRLFGLLTDLRHSSPSYPFCKPSGNRFDLSYVPIT